MIIRNDPLYIIHFENSNALLITKYIFQLKILIT